VLESDVDDSSFVATDIGVTQKELRYVEMAQSDMESVAKEWSALQQPDIVKVTDWGAVRRSSRNPEANQAILKPISSSSY